MPMFLEGQDPLDQQAGPALRTPIGSPSPDPFAVGPNASAVISAAFRQNNPIVSVLDAAVNSSPANTVDPDYNPLTTLKGTPFERDPTPFVGDGNEAMTRWRMDRMRDEENQRQTLAQSGWGGTVASLAAGLADPTYYIPLFGEMHGIEGAAAFGRSALRSAATGAGQTALSEGAMHASQQSRSWSESAGNIATNTLMMGVLGPAVGMLSRGERAAAVDGLEAVRREATPVNPADPTSMSLNDHITPGDSGFSQGVEKRADELHAAGVATSPIEAVEAAHIESLPENIAHEVDGGAAQESIGAAAERGGSGIQPDGGGDPVEPGAGLGSDGGPDLGAGEDADLWPADGRAPGDAGADGGTGDGLVGDAPSPPPDTRPALYPPLPDGANITGGGGGGKAVGADVSDARDLKLKSFGIDKVPGLSKANAQLSPNLRVYSGDSVQAKRTMAGLADTGLRFTQHDRGIPTAPGGTVETAVRQDKAKFMAAAHDVLHAAWTDHFYGDAAPGRLQRGLDSLNAARGQVPDGKLSYKDFKSAVYDAMYSGDAHPVPQVEKAAKEVRAAVFDPIAKRAQETLGPDGRPMLGDALTPPKGDQSFVPRRWNKEAVIPKRYQLAQRITDWLGTEQATKAEAKDRLGDLQQRHEELGGQVDKLERRLEAVRGKQDETGTRLDERGMEVRQSQERADTVGDRAGIIKDHLSELDEFISTMRAQASDPEQRARLADLEREASQLRREASPMSAAELRRVEQGEVADVLPGDLRKGAEVYLGKRRLPERPSFVKSLVKDGGINDVGGDVRSMAGGQRAVRGLINPAGRSLDQIGEGLHNDFPHIFLDRPSVSDVADLIDNSLRGKEPSWWTEAMEPPDSPQGRVREFAGVLEDFFRSAGTQPGTLREVAEALKSDRGDIPAVLERLQQKVDAGRDLAGATVDIAGRRAAFGELRDLIERGREERAGQRQRGQVANARAGEADVAANRSRGRLGLLQDRLGRQQMMEDLLDAARQNAEDERTSVRGKIEDEVRGWKGKSSAEAIAALDARREAERVRGLKQEAGVYQGDGDRLTSADSAVDRAVKRMLASDRDLDSGELQDRANEIVDRIIGSPDGRIPYDAASGGPKVGFTGGPAQEVRASLKSRDFAIPTALVRDFVHTDMEHVVASYLRTMLPDIELTRRFGDVDLTDPMRRIQEEYARKLGPDTTEKQAKAINAARDSDIKDVAAIRDRLRGVYGWNPDPSSRKLANIVRDFHMLTSLSSLGTSVANRFNDLGGQAVMRHGLMNTFGDAWRPYFKSMLGMSDLARVAKKQAADMGVGIDGLLGHLRHNLSDINESYMPGNKFSRGLAWANDRSMLVNMHGPWTDYTKAMGWTVAQAEFGRVADRIAAGTATAKDLAAMADANITPQMATRISKQFADHSTVVDKTRLATTNDWTDLAARETFERAMSQETNRLVMTGGAGTTPLFVSKPIGSLIGQFKSFVAAAHENILISNIQQRDGRTMQGMLVSMAMGMLSYRLYTLLSGQQASERPQDWIKEGLARSALTGWFNEENNLLAKFTAGKVDYNRLYGADRPLSRRTENSPLSELLGPTYARMEGLAGIGVHVLQGKGSAADIHQARMALPLQNLMGVRRGFDDVEDGVSNSLGIKPRNHTPTQWPGGPTPYPSQ